MPSPNRVDCATGGDAKSLPLATLLSQVLVAFTIEFDNEFEHQMPHRTTRLKSAGETRSGPWLVSMVMWSNLMRYVPEEGVTVGQLQASARTEKLSLAGMERWGYILVEPDPADRRPRQPQRDWMVRPTRKGLRAQQMWRPLFEVIEKRWQSRFGQEQIEALRESLTALVIQLNTNLPDYLPVLGYGLRAGVYSPKGQAAAAPETGSEARLDLPALLSKVLLAFTIDFEGESDLSLAICANIMRVLDESGARVRDVPRLSGVSKEAIKVALSFLAKQRYIVLEPDPTAARAKLVRLTPKGRLAQDAYRQGLSVIEDRWQARFGQGDISKLRESLEALVGAPNAELSPLFLGLEPHPSGWRALVPKPDTLPHYPMVLHRGGYPDGS
jgi:DNA-binding MarR family transcriptional regulator